MQSGIHKREMKQQESFAGDVKWRMMLASSILLSIPQLWRLSNKSMLPTVMFSRSRCLLWTVSHSLRIFSLILFMSFSFSSLAEEASCSNSRSRIIRSRLALSKSMFKRSLLRMYIRAAVQRDKFLGWERKKKKNQLAFTNHFRQTFHYFW